MAYDDENVFAKILRGKIPCAKVYEDDHAFAFNDINPQAPVHVLGIPKGEYVSLGDFTRDAPVKTGGRFFQKVGEIARQLGVDGDGYRAIANIGQNGGQEVPHFHIHINDLIRTKFGPFSLNNLKKGEMMEVEENTINLFIKNKGIL